MERNIVSMIESRAKRLGNRDVLKSKDIHSNNYSAITWAEFWEKSQRLARAILTLGYNQGSNIGIMCDNMPEWTITDIAILASRNVVVPFFGNASQEQIKFIVDHTQMRLMFVGNQSQLDNANWALKNCKTLERVVVIKKDVKLPNGNCQFWDDFVTLDKEGNQVNELNKRIQEIDAEDLATILYTSGTTGDPKGVMLAHSNFTNCFEIHDKRLDLTKDDISLCFLPLSHVFERTWTYYLLYKDATNVYLENPRAIIDEIKVVKPTVMCTVPRFFEKTYDGVFQEMEKWPSFRRKVFKWAIRQGTKAIKYKSKSKKVPFPLNLKQRIAETLVFSKFRSVLGGNIRSLPCSGAAISPNHLKFFHAAGIFVNYGYGTTETTATVSCFKNDLYDLNACGSIMPEVQVKFSDIGEIMVKGKTVFKGYYNNPEATQKALIDGWYKTGDKGYLTEVGDLVMTDRLNDIFKTSGGKFISPQKIELLLLSDVFIDQAVVIGDNRKYITALIVPSFEKFRAIWTAEGIEKLSNEELVEHPRVINFIRQRIDSALISLPSYEKVVKFKLLVEPFTIQNEGLTNTLKVRRRLIAERYKELIDNMYLPSESPPSVRP